jgi:uncharacterized Zn finger protein
MGFGEEGGENTKLEEVKCPKCGSEDVEIVDEWADDFLCNYIFECLSCRNKFQVKTSEQVVSVETPK